MQATGQKKEAGKDVAWYGQDEHKDPVINDLPTARHPKEDCSTDV